MRQIINLEEERLLRSYDKIGKALVDYISDMDLTWEIEMARRVYFGKYLNDIKNEKPYSSYKPFIQWLIFSYKLQSGSSLIDCICSKYLDNKNSYEKDALTSLKDTYESFYKVYSIEDNRILVKDLFSHNNLYIHDNILVHNVKRYSGIFTRIVKFNNKNIPIPGYSIMTNSFLKQTEKYILEKYKNFKVFNSDSSIHEFINCNSLMIHRFFLDYDI